jgi:ribosome-associated protein
MKREPEHREGRRSNDWAMLDFGGFIVHVFSEPARRYYDIERLWRNIPKRQAAIVLVNDFGGNLVVDDALKDRLGHDYLPAE